MIKQYKINEEKKRKFLKEQPKKHPKWQTKSLFLKLLRLLQYGSFVIAAILPIIEYRGIIFGGATFDEILNLDIDLYIVGYICVAGLIVWTPIHLFFHFFKMNCSDEIKVKTNETLATTNEEIQYCFIYNHNTPSYVTHQIKYEDIKRIVVNKFHNRIDIYCDATINRYSDYEKGEIADGGLEIDFKRRFYFYFDNMDEFIKIISEKSGIKVEEIDYAEE